MKRFISLAVLALAIVAAGCKGATVQQPLAPGYNNAADQQMGSILAGARGFYVQLQQDSASGKTVLSPTEKTALNDLGASINFAESVYLAYHAGTATEAQAQAAVTTVQQKQAAVPLPTGGK